MLQKRDRIQEVYRRLAVLPRCSSFGAMREQLSVTLIEVENELTPFPYDAEVLNPEGRQKPTERMYPIQDDNLNEVAGHPLVKRLRSRSENTFIGANGSIEIRSTKQADGTKASQPEAGMLIFSKPGSDGRGVWEI